MRSCWLIAYVLPMVCSAQNWDDTLSLRMAAWNAVRERSDTLTIGEVMDDEWRINTELGEAMAHVLRVPDLSDHQIDSLFSSDRIWRRRSADGRLLIFQWDERTGGTFRAMLHLVFYRDAKGEGHPVFSYGLADSLSEDDKYWSRGGGYAAIHRLGSTDSSTLYVCVGGVRGCSTCCSEILTVLELTDTGINLDYPAFDLPLDKWGDGVPRKGPTWELTSRCGDITRFAYDPKARVLSYTYTSDDRTPVTTDQDPGQEISGTMRFDGRAFIME